MTVRVPIETVMVPIVIVRVPIVTVRVPIVIVRVPIETLIKTFRVPDGHYDRSRLLIAKRLSGYPQNC